MGLTLSVSGLTVAGDDGRAILKVGRLAIEPGLAIGLRGPSGAGKSTLLFALSGLARIATGSVVWGDRDLAAMSERDRTAFRRRRIGMIFQEFLLFEELGAASNAGLAADFSTRAERPAVAVRAGEILRRLRVPVAARSVASFSGGERQRVAVARALATDPAIILADEPTASLDRAAADPLLDDLLQLTRDGGKTLIVVSHDATVQARMDRIYDLADGVLLTGPSANA
jgi:putative ABC transport system ATP-binding protein